jgi:hypothetical protein
MKSVFSLLTILVLSSFTFKAQAVMGPSAGGGTPPPPRAISVVFHTASGGDDEAVKKAVLKLAAGYIAKGQIAAMGDLPAKEDDDRAKVCLQFKEVSDMWDALPAFQRFATPDYKIDVITGTACFQEMLPELPKFPGGPNDPNGPMF